MSLLNTKILIIDDDSNFRALTRKILEAQGVLIHEAEDLTKAFSILKDLIPDLILLDLQLSEIEHGSSFLKIRNSNSHLQLIPVVICSSDSRKDMVKKVIDLGVNDYILKPYRPDWLIKKIKKTLKKKDHLEYHFTEEEQKETVRINCEGELISIGEANCILRSPINFPKHENTILTLEGIEQFIKSPAKPEDLDGKDFNSEKMCKSNSKSRPSLQGQYDTLFTMLGISEREASFLRKLKVNWGKFN